MLEATKRTSIINNGDSITTTNSTVTGDPSIGWVFFYGLEAKTYRIDQLKNSEMVIVEEATATAGTGTSIHTYYSRQTYEKQ